MKYVVDLGGLGVKCSPRDLRFAGSNPADGSFQDKKKNPEHKSSGRDLNLGVPSVRFRSRKRNSSLKK